MKTLLFASMLVAATSFGAVAQTATTAPTPAPNAEADKNAPLPGANSFTEGQAKSRLEANGYSNVTELKKDENGVWRGSAMHTGATVNVSVDYRGNIVRN
ncbi:PepSY domain-containing protein [Bosea sp. (in: a-proteobacteria)]|uniref:PepSY domain-containing protein n=1 Tax=Bosea sp. (in: a-proteobacteria) TaxID=1871050 RepID=UPI002736F42E|nr:PepSY domain-containing protein [Bosea sp. (in: a-proteobacteria)]MDP3409413.1 PepSY domain-containing protein [Bosea sp. (in: a-proteobacteria)]